MCVVIHRETAQHCLEFDYYKFFHEDVIFDDIFCYRKTRDTINAV
jgi:hypothetical protein